MCTYHTILTLLDLSRLSACGTLSQLGECWICVSGCWIVESYVKILLHDHIRDIHAQYLLSGPHLLPSNLQAEAVITRKGMLKDLALQAFFNSFHLNNNLLETVNIIMQGLFLPLNDLSQRSYIHQLSLPGSKMRRELLRKNVP